MSMRVPDFGDEIVSVSWAAVVVDVVSKGVVLLSGRDDDNSFSVILVAVRNSELLTLVLSTDTDESDEDADSDFVEKVTLVGKAVIIEDVSVNVVEK